MFTSFHFVSLCILCPLHFHHKSFHQMFLVIHISQGLFRFQFKYSPLNNFLNNVDLIDLLFLIWYFISSVVFFFHYNWMKFKICLCLVFVIISNFLLFSIRSLLSQNSYSQHLPKTHFSLSLINIHLFFFFHRYFVNCCWCVFITFTSIIYFTVKGIVLIGFIYTFLLICCFFFLFYLIFLLFISFLNIFNFWIYVN